jgi:hypothetical protein
MVVIQQVAAGELMLPVLLGDVVGCRARTEGVMAALDAVNAAAQVGEKVEERADVRAA